MSPSPLVLTPHTKDLGGGFTVRRLLPAAARQAVGPFLFFDHFGPLTARPEDDHDVRPHPHIGLATLSYLFEGALQHHDSTGARQRIEPGAVNWMTAGSGIVHSERTPDDLRGRPRRSHGLQLWAALPEADEEMAPSFAHTPAAAIPALEVGGAQVRVLVGAAFGATSPVAVRSETLYLDITLAVGDAFPLPLAPERALYVIEGAVELDGSALAPQRMQLLAPGDEPMLAASGAARVVLIGGEPLGHRHIYWNFVSSRRERLVQAADDWEAQRFAALAGETDLIPLPPTRPR
ncbi:Pirin-like protein CC_3178 [Rubrivivax sp. A210]|uniref:pirin family protein n=1 Tax=Rubrivivax sp. A210 TaxID=2772301 RepID=UPI0019192A5B|nr:pirin family protein [Rubrivivax sp. A210]CAD5372651.1 Pirin-like protein CC_3178 [Rubrivivax sp. A210]